MRPNQEQRILDIQKGAAALRTQIISLTPISREQSLSFTKLDECIMWAEQAILRNEK